MTILLHVNFEGSEPTTPTRDIASNGLRQITITPPPSLEHLSGACEWTLETNFFFLAYLFLVLKLLLYFNSSLISYPIL